MFWIFTLSLCNSCSHLLYYPTRVLYIKPGSIPVAPKEVTYSPENQPKLVAWHFKSPQKTKAVILLFHGNAQNVSSHFYTYYWAVDLGYDLFVFDYPGYGGSHGDPTPQNTVESGLLALKYVQEQWPNTPIVVAGQSLGGNVSLKTLTLAPHRKNICAVVIESSFLSYRTTGQKIFARQWLTWPFQWLPLFVLSDQWAAKKSIDQLPDLPYLLFHRENDPIVPIKMGQDLFAKLPANKQAYFLKGEGHVDTYSQTDAQENKKIFQDFITKSCHAVPL